MPNLALRALRPAKGESELFNGERARLELLMFRTIYTFSLSIRASWLPTPNARLLNSLFCILIPTLISPLRPFRQRNSVGKIGTPGRSGRPISGQLQQVGRIASKIGC